MRRLSAGLALALLTLVAGCATDRVPPSAWRYSPGASNRAPAARKVRIAVLPFEDLRPPSCRFEEHLYWLRGDWTTAVPEPQGGLDAFPRLYAQWLGSELSAAGCCGRIENRAWKDLLQGEPPPNYVLQGKLYGGIKNQWDAAVPAALVLELRSPGAFQQFAWSKTYDLRAPISRTPEDEHVVFIVAGMSAKQVPSASSMRLVFGEVAADIGKVLEGFSTGTGPVEAVAEAAPPQRYEGPLLGCGFGFPVNNLPEELLSKARIKFQGISSTKGGGLPASRKTLKDLKRFLADQSWPERPFADYRDEFGKSLEAFFASTRSDYYKWRFEDAMAFLPLFEDRLDLKIEAMIAVSTLADETGDRAEAEQAGQEAAAICSNSYVSPTRLAKCLSRTHARLGEHYGKAGKPGKTLLAKLNSQLAADYLASEQGVQDFYLEQQSFWDAYDARVGVERSVLNTGHKRAMAHDDRVAAAVAVVGGAVTVMGQTQINRALAKTGGVVTPEIRMMQMNKMLLDFNLGAIAARQAGKAVGLGTLLNPLSNVTMLGQLVDPKMGVNPFGIIKGFAGDAAKLDPGLGQAAKGVNQLADALADTRKKGDPEKTKASAEDFIKVFTDFQAKVQEIR